ncbi:hypothetical protein I4U23_008177 [Adineta vaga]|nr:hypothetical protein I4U23_008177 [Adineta vaga]
MIMKFYCLLFLIGLISSVTSRSLQLNVNKPKEPLSTTTLAPEILHLTVHENSYTAEEEYKYINDCVQKCMENHSQQQQQSKSKAFDTGRDNCIQLQCRIYQRRR